MRHVLEVVDRHDLGLGHAVNVDVGADAVFDALRPQLLLRLLDLVAYIHLHRTSLLLRPLHRYSTLSVTSVRSGTIG